MEFKPHSYQQFAINHILNNEIAALFLDMGLGKTVITLSAIQELMYDRFEINKVLVIAPLRVAIHTWPSELKKWEHLKYLTCSVITGTKKKRIEALKRDADIHVINRENLQWLIKDSGYDFDFDMVVIDELSSFKDGKTQRVKSLLSVRPMIKRIVGLTGTPSSNGLMDLWAQFRVLDMGERLGRYISHYRNSFFVPDKRNQHQIFTYKPIPGAKRDIYELISDITISMKGQDYLKMPKLISNAYDVVLDDKAKARYKELQKEMLLEFGEIEIDASNAAALSNKLLQMANGAVYSSEKEVFEIHDGKLDALEDIIEAANGKPILVAYWFKHDLERIKKRFKVREIKKEQDIEDWNAGKIEVGMIHPASAGHGLNLQKGGSTLVWFGLTWSLELYQQTNARLYRQGQDNTVVITHIIALDTIDEDVMRALEFKNTTQEELIAAVKAKLEV